MDHVPMEVDQSAQAAVMDKLSIEAQYERNMRAAAAAAAGKKAKRVSFCLYPAYKYAGKRNKRSKRRTKSKW